MPRIGITTPTKRAALRYVEAVRNAGSEAVLLLPQTTSNHQANLLPDIDGLLLSCAEDSHLTPDLGQSGRDSVPEAPILRAALDCDMPILCICGGMHALNLALGGELIHDVSGHTGELTSGKLVSTYHHIWISLGSKLAATIGSGGTVRVNSLHQHGLREAHKSPRMIASAYSPSDFLIEGLESLHHTWALGIQCHPERADEVPRQFQRLFQALAARAEEWRSAKT